MGKVSDLESFIDVASDLLSAYPSSTTLSITYTNVAKKSKDSKVTKPNTKKASNAVHFKLFEPKSGKCIKYNTYKIKELSRLLAFIGPRGVNVVTSTSTGQDHVDGLASIMSNVKYSNEDENVAVSSTANVAANSGIETPEEFSHDTTPVPASKPATASKKKNKKKKGKK